MANRMRHFPFNGYAGQLGGQLGAVPLGDGYLDGYGGGPAILGPPIVYDPNGTTISGRVLSSAGTGLSNVTVSLYNGVNFLSAVTDSNGNYTFQGLQRDANATITVGWSGYSPRSVTPRNNVSNFDFLAAPPVPTVSDPSRFLTDGEVIGPGPAILGPPVREPNPTPPTIGPVTGPPAQGPPVVTTAPPAPVTTPPPATTPAASSEPFLIFGFPWYYVAGAAAIGAYFMMGTGK